MYHSITAIYFSYLLKSQVIFYHWHCTIHITLKFWCYIRCKSSLQNAEASCNYPFWKQMNHPHIRNKRGGIFHCSPQTSELHFLLTELQIVNYLELTAGLQLHIISIITLSLSVAFPICRTWKLFRRVTVTMEVKIAEPPKDVKPERRRLRVGDPDFVPPDGGWGWMIVLACGFSNVRSTYP